MDVRRYANKRCTPGAVAFDGYQCFLPRRRNIDKMAHLRYPCELLRITASESFTKLFRKAAAPVARYNYPRIDSRK